MYLFLDYIWKIYLVKNIWCLEIKFNDLHSKNKLLFTNQFCTEIENKINIYIIILLILYFTIFQKYIIKYIIIIIKIIFSFFFNYSKFNNNAELEISIIIYRYYSILIILQNTSKLIILQNSAYTKNILTTINRMYFRLFLFIDLKSLWRLI